MVAIGDLTGDLRQEGVSDDCISDLGRFALDIQAIVQVDFSQNGFDDLVEVGGFQVVLIGTSGNAESRRHGKTCPGELS